MHDQHLLEHAVARIKMLQNTQRSVASQCCLEFWVIEIKILDTPAQMKKKVL